MEYRLINILKRQIRLKGTNKYWFNVLFHFEKRRYFRNGLTIPFLIGSRSIIEPIQVIQSIPEFIPELINYSESTTIMKCENIREYVIGILDFETKVLISRQYKGLYKEFGNLVIIDNSFRKFQKVDELILHFEDLYKHILNKKLYSKQNGEWKEFSETDLLRLNEIKNMIH